MRDCEKAYQGEYGCKYINDWDRQFLCGKDINLVWGNRLF